MTPRSLHVPTAVAAAMLTAAMLNVVQFAVVERETSDWYDAVRVKPGHDVGALVTNHFSSTRERFELYVQLRELAPGVTVVLPDSLAVYGEQLRGLGAASETRRISQELTIGIEAAAQLADHVMASGEEPGLGRYAIALQEGPVEEVVVVQGPEQAWVVDRSLLEAVAPGVAP